MGGSLGATCARVTTLGASADTTRSRTMAKASKKILKKIDKLEKQAEDLRKKAEKKGKDLQSMASDKIEELGKDEDKGGKKGVFALLLAIGAGVAVALKRKRDQELDEALWEEPRSI
jgi:hypothetical protein